MSALRKPRYSGKYLRSTIRSMLGETRVSDTLTNVVIPTFDIKLLQPIIFSTYDVRRRRNSQPPNARSIPFPCPCTIQPPWSIDLQARSTPLKNALLSDVCISTSAAPTYLPAHYFKTQDAGGKAREYNLIDGGVAANNPVIDRMEPELNKVASC